MAKITDAGRDHLKELRTALGDAADHLDDAAEAHARGAKREVERAHARLRRSLRAADASLKDAENSIEVETPTNTQVQTSGGISDSGGSTGGRHYSPLYRGDVLGFLDSARRGAAGGRR